MSLPSRKQNKKFVLLCIRDLESTGWVKIRIRIRDEQSESCFRKLRNYFFGLKYLNSLMRMEKNSDPGSETKIPDPQHCSTVQTECVFFPIS